VGFVLWDLGKQIQVVTGFVVLAKLDCGLYGIFEDITMEIISRNI
jgi:hypothetical protein